LPTWLGSVNLYHVVQSMWKSVKLDIIIWLIGIKFFVTFAHSSICTACDKGKGTAISALAYSTPEIVPWGSGSQISRHSTHEGGQIVNPMYCPSFYYHRYSALGPVWAETRAQSGDWFGSGMRILGNFFTIFTPRKYSWCSFLSGAGLTLGPLCGLLYCVNEKL